MPKVLLLLQSARCMALMRARGHRIGLVLCEGRLPVLHGGGEVRIGRLSLRNAVAPVELGSRDGGVLTIGRRVFVNQGATVVAHQRIAIDDDVRIGDYVAIYDADHHPVEQGAAARRAPVSIGRNAWIGRGAIVLPGVTIGEHAVVAAGSVVTADVPPRTLVGGNPARTIRQLAADDDWRRP